MIIDGVPVQTRNIISRTVRALAVTTDTRSPALPDIPTMGIRIGLRGARLDHHLCAGRTPDAIVGELAAAIGKAMKADDVTKRLAEVGTEAVARRRPSSTR